MPRLKVLITVTTYPLPSSSYEELVCTAGVLESGEWIRIYPVPLEFMRGMKIKGQFQRFKYTWIELDLRERTDDIRPESYSPIDYGFKDLVVHGNIDAKNFWSERKSFCLNNVYTNLDTLIAESRDPRNKSLATFKPKEILNFRAVPDAEEWKPEWKAQLQQLQLDFEKASQNPTKRELIRKVPFKFYYDFIDENDKVSKMMIEDWEIGELYWKCLSACKGDKDAAVIKVKQRYFDTFKKKHDVHLFLGTTKQWHIRRSPNPFVIIGVFYPLKNPDTQLNLQL
jgi:hypothetical protein